MNRKFNRKSILVAIKDWGKILILLLDEAVVISAIFLILRVLGVKIPVPIIIGGGVIIGIFVFIIHVVVIPSFHRKQVTGREGMIGKQGRVVEPLNPVGTITVKGEYWKAKSVDDGIEADENVEIVGLEELTLMVKRKDR